MRTLLRGTALILVLAALSCSPPRIDGSDAERTRSTIAAARRSLPSERQPVFDRALKDLMYHADPLPLLSNPAVRAAIDGKTGEEVIKAAEDLRRDEEARKHDAQVRAEMAQIDGEFSSIAARDRAAAAKAAAGGSSLPASDTQGQLTTAGTTATTTATTTITDTAAVIAAADPEVRDYCHQKALTKTALPPTLEAECVRDEMAGKKAVTGALPAGVTAEVGQRIRDNCTQKNPGSYRDREACESADTGSILNVGTHPELLPQLSKARQEELHKLMGH